MKRGEMSAMDYLDLLERISVERGLYWNAESKKMILARYIAEMTTAPNFEEFVKRVADEETIGDEV